MMSFGVVCVWNEVLPIYYHNARIDMKVFVIICANIKSVRRRQLTRPTEYTGKHWCSLLPCELCVGLYKGWINPYFMCTVSLCS